MNTIDSSKVTATTLQGLSAHDAIDFIRAAYPAEVVKTHKRPRLLERDHTANDAIEYAKDLSKYEHAKDLYDSQEKERDTEINRLNDLLENYLKEQSGLTRLPQATQARVWGYAWDKGHAYGYTEVWSYLNDLVDLFDGIEF